ncbi:rhomboid family intramembrane serine protease [Methylobacter sp. Wu1]|uniref:rhomboid family intramembrane serine protease n=1 Tax=Methylobacter sp. Wu1 TaxID=3119359 RepID=UPI002F9271D6
MIPIRDTAPCNIRPWVTWGLIAICITIFIAMQLMPYELSYRLIYRYGMVPIRYTEPQWAFSFGLPDDYYLSFLTSLFLHGNWWHLAINMVFMWIFADNIEDRMGHGPFLIFYLVCGLCATFLQWYFDPRLAIPVVGASGAIAGVLAAYFFLYPMARVILWIPLFFLPIVVHVPAIAFLGLWVIIQLHDAMTSVVFEGVTVDVAWWAHLGGFATGTILYRLFIRDEPNEPVEEK